jgi:hypothetical protein
MGVRTLSAPRCATTIIAGPVVVTDGPTVLPPPGAAASTNTRDARKLVARPVGTSTAHIEASAPTPPLGGYVALMTWSAPPTALKHAYRALVALVNPAYPLRLPCSTYTLPLLSVGGDVSSALFSRATQTRITDPEG